MVTWIDRIYYDIGRDCDMSRISGFDDRSQEHWTLIPCGTIEGRTYRERRDEAVLAIQDSIETGNHPGEVKLP